MKVKSLVMVALVTMFTAGSAFAMMANPGSNMAGGMWGAKRNNAVGVGYGMKGSGGMKNRMLVQTMKNGYLDVLTPIAAPQDAVTAVNDFIAAANSSLQIYEIWEYPTVYKAELSDTSGQMAFDVLVDKVTGAVTPEMGFPMMMNASWGVYLQKTPKFGKKLILTPDEAAVAALAFVSKNANMVNYNLAAPETYPGYYKFHTMDTSGKTGMDIMVNGYNGGIWMNTQLGAPISQVYSAP